MSGRKVQLQSLEFELKYKQIIKLKLIRQGFVFFLPNQDCRSIRQPLGSWSKISLVAEEVDFCLEWAVKK
jgi:hypothetical protein